MSLSIFTFTNPELCFCKHERRLCSGLRKSWLVGVSITLKEIKYHLEVLYSLADETATTFQASLGSLLMLVMLGMV